MPLTTYEVTCISCGKPKWPSLPERPQAYTCVLCSMGGTGQATRRESGRKGGLAAQEAKQRAKIERKRSLEPSPEGPLEGPLTSP